MLIIFVQLKFVNHGTTTCKRNNEQAAQIQMVYIIGRRDL